MTTSTSSRTCFDVELPCPQCGERRLFGYLIRNERGEHQHTRYVCTFWPTHGEMCGWEGWVVPIPDGEASSAHAHEYVGSLDRRCEYPGCRLRPEAGVHLWPEPAIIRTNTLVDDVGSRCGWG